MSRFRNPLRVNGFLILGITFIVLVSGGFEDSSGTLMVGTFMLLLAPVNLIVGMVRNRDKKQDGSAFIICAGLLLLMGFSTCGLGLSFGDLNFH